ncbi:Crp/Fnr family transcriptional regulator [Pyruvatibacter sp. HU-CL02332]|uniref:Crp/Fnr family transcriptional regulator n=1 Tax=Pyruvatibacter sp. HU-CL02332 TaxID=3127650 RepID=UPI0031032DDA
MGVKVSNTRSVVEATIDRVDLFSTWPDDVKAELRTAAELWTFSKGEVVLQAGEPAHSVVVIVEGSLVNERAYANGKHMMTAVLRPGWPLKVPAVLNGLGVPFGLTARVDCLVLFIPKQKFLDIVNSQIELLQNVTNFIGLQYHQDMVSLQLRTMASLECQFALLMIFHAQDAAHLIDEDRGVSNTNVLDVTQEEFASMLGCSRQKINVIMKQMERDGLIERHGRLVEIINYVGLLELIEQEDPVHHDFRTAIEIWQERLEQSKSH